MPQQPPFPESAVWQLHGTTAKDATCVIRHTPSGLWEIRIVRADETLLSETFPDAASALARANKIRDSLIENGWTQVPVVGGAQFT
jgi:hypothetical protein